MAWIDWALPTIIVVGLILAVWAKTSGQTIMDLMRDIADFISEKKEETAETTANIGIYDR